jgi:hypothetical protein
VTGAGIVLVAGSLLPGPLGETSATNPFALAGPAGTVATALFDVGLAWAMKFAVRRSSKAPPTSYPPRQPKLTHNRTCVRLARQLHRCPGTSR